MYKNVAVFVIFYLFFFFIYLMGAGKHTGACFDFTNWGTWKVLLRESNLFCLDTVLLLQEKMNHMKNVWTLGPLELPAKMFHDS